MNNTDDFRIAITVNFNNGYNVNVNLITSGQISNIDKPYLYKYGLSTGYIQDMYGISTAYLEEKIGVETCNDR